MNSSSSALALTARFRRWHVLAPAASFLRRPLTERRTQQIYISSKRRTKISEATLILIRRATKQKSQRVVIEMGPGRSRAAKPPGRVEASTLTLRDSQSDLWSADRARTPTESASVGTRHGTAPTVQRKVRSGKVRVSDSAATPLVFK